MLLVSHVKFAVSDVTIRRLNDFLIHRSLELQIDAGNIFFRISLIKYLASSQKSPGVRL